MSLDSPVKNSIRAAFGDLRAASEVITNLNLLDGVTAGTVTAGLAVVPTTGKVIDEIDITTPKIGGTAILATAAELNRAADVSTRVVTLVASGAISVATHEGKTLLLGEVGGNAAVALTLPAATGSGAIYRFIVSVANTSNYTITTNSTDVYNGAVLAHDRDVTDGTLLHSFPATTQTIITLNGGTTGGQIGDWIIIEDILSGVWHVRGQVAVPTSSNPATMFS